MLYVGHWSRVAASGFDPTQSGGWREFEARTPVEGLCFEAAEAAYRVVNGFTETQYLPLQESVAVMEALDTIRAQIKPSL